MSYPKRLRKIARELAVEGLSAEKIADIFSKEVQKGKHDYTPTPRTLRNWLKQEQGELKATPVEHPQLIRHYDDLAIVATTLADNMAAIRDFSEFLEESGPLAPWDVGIEGNLIIGGYYGVETNDGRVSPLGGHEEYSKLEEVNSFDAKCLLEHLNYLFPNLVRFKGWHEIKAHDITREVVDTLYILARSKNFGISPTCQVCIDIQR